MLATIDAGVDIGNVTVVSIFIQAEVDVNTPVELSSLVSSSDLPLREGEGERKPFYLTTAINYTNGEMSLKTWQHRHC